MELMQKEYFDPNSPDPAIGIDIGNHKIKATNGHQTFIIESAIQEYKTTHGYGTDEPIIEYENKKWLIGRDAIRNGADFTPSESKNTTKTTIAILYAIAKLFPENTQNPIIPWLYLGLPVSSYFNNVDKMALKEMLLKNHAISIGTQEDYNNNTTRRVFIQIAETSTKEIESKFEIAPEPFGTILNKIYTLSSDHKLFKTDPAYYGKTSTLNQIGVVDIGFFTTDLLYMNILKTNETLSRHKAIGIKHLLDLVREELIKNNPTDRNIQIAKIKLADVADAIQNKEIILGQKPYPIEKELTTAQIKFAKELEDFIKDTWPETILYSLNEIFVTGGGGTMMYPFLQKMIPVPINLSKDAQLANVNGFYKQAAFKKALAAYMAAKAAKTAKELG